VQIAIMTGYQMARRWLAYAFAIACAHGALAQQPSPALTPAGREVLQEKLSAEALYGQAHRDHPRPPLTFPLPMCAFPGGLCGAVNRDGSVAVPPRYDWVGSYHDGRAAMRNGGLYGFVDENGGEIVPPRYRIVGDYKFGFAQVDVDGKSGLIDRNGEFVFEPRYSFIEVIGPDRFRASEERRPTQLIGTKNIPGMQPDMRAPRRASLEDLALDLKSVGVIDRNGRWIEPPGTRTFDRDDASIRIARSNDRWGVQRPDGSWLVEPKFERIDTLSDGLALVRIDGKIGFIDRTGKFAIEPRLERAHGFEAGYPYTSARQDGMSGVIDRAGAWLFRFDADALDRASATIKDPPYGWNFVKDKGWGLLTLDGRVLLNNEFDQAVQWCDGRLIAYKNKEWLYFRPDGSPLQPPNGRINAGCGLEPPFVLTIDGKFGLVDGDGKAITPANFDALEAFGKDAWNVKRDGKWGRIGPDGHWLIEPISDRPLRGQIVTEAGKRGLLLPDGSWLIEPKFEAIRIRRDDTAFVASDGTTGVLRLIDKTWAVPPRPGLMCDIDHGIMARGQGRVALLSRNGEVWVDIAGDDIGPDIEAGLLPFLKDGKWGVVDTAGQMIVPPTYDAPVYFLSWFRGIGWAKREGRWCPIDRRGHQLEGIACADEDPTRGGIAPFSCTAEP
jgi:hypothetical protein